MGVFGNSDLTVCIASDPWSSPGVVVGDPAATSRVFEDAAPLVEAGDDCGAGTSVVDLGCCGLDTLVVFDGETR